jgi:EAL domain-containing protein (putative c-di-GMP-specific phosphodiesterase class I)/DNA-binding response OmpR family regulator
VKGPSGEGARIFIVDDQEPNVRLLEQLLSRAGFGNTRSFRDGRSMLDALDTDEPDLILLDLHMPAPDGFAVLEALRARDTDDGYLPVLVLTADAERRARSLALAGGAKDFLVKPFDAEEVVLRVRNLAQARLLHQALRARNSDLVGEVAARTSDLRESEAQWAAVTASLGRLATLATPEETADAICDALATLPDLAVVSIMAFGAGGTTVPLARRSTVHARFGVKQALPAAWSGLIRERVAGGSWCGPSSAFGGPAGPQPFDDEVTAVVLVPLRTNRGLPGTLIAATTGTDGPARLARRVPALEAFAALSAALLGPGLMERQRDDELRERIATVIFKAAFRPVFQPILDLDSNRTVGYEALTRFADRTPPDRRFADAAAVNLGLDLEAACLLASLGAARRLGSNCWLSLNVSPGLVLETDRLAGILRDASVPIILEITEHAPIADYVAFRSAIASLGPSVRSAVDDAGAGFSSFRHILELRPDFVKLDIGLVRSIERDPARQALVAGMVYFAVKTGCGLIAEGIETLAERDTLRSLAVDLGQGYLLGKPEPIDELHLEPVRRIEPEMPGARRGRQSWAPGRRGDAPVPPSVLSSPLRRAPRR